jgi:hypothetical protein
MVTGPKRLVKAYHGRLCAERIFKKLKRQLNLENHHYRGLGKRHNPRLYHAYVCFSSDNSLLRGWKTQKGQKHKILDSLKGLKGKPNKRQNSSPSHNPKYSASLKPNLK